MAGLNQAACRRLRLHLDSIEKWDMLLYDYIIKETGKSGGRYVAAAGGFTVCNNRRLFNKPGAVMWIDLHRGDYIILRS